VVKGTRVPDSDMRSRFRWFCFACGFEAWLLLAAAGLARLFHQPILAQVQWSARDAVLGSLAVLPLFGLFWWTLRSARGPLVAVREFLEARVRPLFASWSLAELAVLSLLAGVSEEILFRGVIQGGLTKPLGQPLAILAASLIFGACHPLTRAYFAIATGIGAFMSALWLLTGNLLTPIVTHALYDFVALAYFLRRRRSN